MAHLNRRRFLAAASAALAWPAATAWSQDSAAEVEENAGELITPAARRAINSGLKYLAARQNADGSFGSKGYSRNVAVCSLAGMAFMAGGSTPGRGPYGKQVRRCVNYILANAKDNGYIIEESSDSHGPMYGHGFATLFLAEVYGMSRNPKVRETLSNAVKLIVGAQNESGGWRYQPNAIDADISVTICQVMALRAARNAGIYVDAHVIESCNEYVKRCQNPDGGFMYRLLGGPSAFPRSAAGVVALYSGGIYKGDEIKRGLDYLMEHKPRGPSFDSSSHYFYGHYYAVQAMWQAGGKYWKEWYPAIRQSLIARQDPQGFWADSICPEYGAAMACLILQMPNNYLPIFQR